MIMKKFISAVLIVVLCLGTFVMSSCSENTEVSSEAESVEASAEVSLEESVEESKPQGPITLKVGTYNIANGRDVDWDFSKIAKDIVDNDLDVVGLQEVDILCERSKFTDTMEKLKEFTGMEYYAYFKCIDLKGDEAKYGKKGAYGTAVLSKYPILSTNEIELNPGTQAERRLLGFTKIDFNGTEINFFVTHLTHNNANIRASEFKKVAETVKVPKNVILVGDFNVGSFDEFNVLETLSRVNNPENQYITYPSSKSKIDNICYSSDFTYLEDSAYTFHRSHSDHMLFVAEFQIDPAK
jgi:endonuclease/exonuclease/phosphatase family metal-dependent hydrolase